MILAWYLLSAFDVGHPERFEVVVWLPVVQDVFICAKHEPTIRLGPETKNKLGYLVSDSLAPLFSIFVLSARGVLDLDFMIEWPFRLVRAGHTDSVIQFEHHVKKALVLFVVHHSAQFEYIELLYLFEPRYPVVSAPLGEIM